MSRKGQYHQQDLTKEITESNVQRQTDHAKENGK